MDDWGVGWARADGRIVQAFAPGHDRPRCVYVDFLNTGPAVSKTLRAVVTRHKAIRKAGDLVVVDLVRVDGEIAGAINRVPAEGETRSNLHVGGTAKETKLSEREREICARLAPELKQRGLLFTGIYVIGDYLTEINVTSPTGIRQVKACGGNDIAAMIWDAIEAKVAAKR